MTVNGADREYQDLKTPLLSLFCGYNSGSPCPNAHFAEKAWTTRLNSEGPRLGAVSDGKGYETSVANLGPGIRELDFLSFKQHQKVIALSQVTQNFYFLYTDT